MGKRKKPGGTSPPAKRRRALSPREWWRVIVLGAVAFKTAILETYRNGEPFMLIKQLIYIGLAVIPLVLIPGYDTRGPKMGLAVAIAMTISLLALYYGKYKAFRNRWLLVFLGYLLANFYFAPEPVELVRASVPNLWAWKPMFFMTIFVLMIAILGSLEFSARDKRRMLVIMAWVGVLQSFYVLLQAFGIDQFCMQKPGWLWLNRIGGSMGNRTLVAPFIAMVIPIALYLRTWWKAAVMAGAVAICHSQMALGAAAVSLMFYFGTLNRRLFLTMIGTGVVITIVLIVGFNTNDAIHKFVGESGRFAEWKQIIHDWHSPLQEGTDHGYALTGLGIGSFRYIYHQWHPSNFFQAHNEYLQILFEAGAVGLFLMLGAMVWIFRKNFSFADIWARRTNRYRIALLSSFLSISIAALGTFVWQLGATIFYSVVLVGLLHNHLGDDGEHGLAVRNEVTFVEDP